MDLLTELILLIFLIQSVEDVVTQSKEDNNTSGSKMFCTFIKHHRNEKVRLTSLKSEGKLFTDSARKANILNRRFQTAFSIKIILTSNQFTERKGMKNRSTKQLSSITISIQGIDKIVRNPNPHKAPGPDDSSPRILQETQRETAPLL